MPLGSTFPHGLARCRLVDGLAETGLPGRAIGAHSSESCAALDVSDNSWHIADCCGFHNVAQKLGVEDRFGVFIVHAEVKRTH